MNKYILLLVLLFGSSLVFGQSTTNNTSACPDGIVTGCNLTTIMPYLGKTSNTGLQTMVIDPLPTNVSSLDLHTMLYAGATTRTMLEYQPWWCNTSNPCNGHKVNGMQESFAAQALKQLQYMKTIGGDVTDLDWYGGADFMSTPQSSAQHYNEVVTQQIAAQMLANPSTTPKMMIMVDGGAVSGTGTGQCPHAAGDQSTCLIAAFNLQLDYLAKNYLYKSYYETNATNGHPIVLYFIGFSGWPDTNFNTVFAGVKAHATAGNSCGTACTYTTTVDFVDENAGGFSESGIDGGYGWPQPLTYSSTNQFTYNGTGGTYLSNFYSTARGSPSKIAMGVIYKGFDDNNAGWGSNRVIAQQCGQVLNLTANAISTAGYNSGSQLQYVQFATWNDYEESTEIETGVDNCITIGTPIIASGNINWTLNKSDLTYASTSTISSFSIYTGTLTPTTLYASGIPATSTSYAVPLPASGVNVWVYMVGKPLIQNRLSPAVSISTCAMPNPCAYDGVDLVQWGTLPTFSSGTNGIQNNAVGYDNSYLGHKTFTGATYASGPCPGPTCTLSQVTRITDAASSPGKACNYGAGIGGSGEFSVVNTNSTLVGIVCSTGGLEYIGLFNPTGPNIGHFTPVHTGVLLTQDLCQSGTLCHVGTSGVTNDFGAISFSSTDPSIVFTFGANSSDITGGSYDGMNVCPYQINWAASTPILGAPIGAYQLLPCVVDFKYGLPQQNAQQWTNGHPYAFGNYVIHNLTTAEMATSGVWSTAHTYVLGDIVVAQGGSIACMYRVTTAPGVATSGSSPAFVNTAPCKVDTLTDLAGNKWRGTNSTASFLYQNTNTACTGFAPCTSGASFSIGAGNHPDLLSVINDNSNTWVNVGPAYVPTQTSQVWLGTSGVSKDCTYVVGGLCFPSKYAVGISTNTYGDNLSGGGYSKYTGGQGSGSDFIEYDATANAFQHLNTLTGIWNTYTCGTGNGASCGSIVTSTVGTVPLTAIANPLGTGQACPFFIHNMKVNTTGVYGRITNQVNVFSVCSSPFANHYMVWNMQPGSFNAITSLVNTFGGMNHSAVDTTELVAFNGGSASPGGFNGGWFNSVYPLASVNLQPGTSTYLKPGSNLPGSGLYPTGCNTTPGINPDCNLSDVFDSHLSCVGGCEDRAQHACGTTFNYATLSPIAFNAWQNMETCYPTGTVYQVGSLPATSAGGVSQFTHAFNTNTNLSFNTQFTISEWSQDGNWLFFGTDYACQLGSTTGAAPAVWSSGTHVGFLAVSYVATSPLPSTLTSLCGVPWLPASAYVTGNTIDPIENTAIGGVDDVFQVIRGGTSGPANQPGGTNNQPVCVSGGLNVSCFAITNPPTAGAAGDTICDNQNFNGTGVPVTGTQLNSINPALPYSSSCPNGVVYQDVGPQNSRGDVFAVQLAGYGGVSSLAAPALVIFAEDILNQIPVIGGNL